VGRSRPPRGRGVRDCDDQSHVPSEPLCQSNALQLRGSQLRLKVSQASLNLNKNHFNGAVQNHVRRSAIRWTRHWHLEADAPGRVGRCSNDVGKLKLARVAKPNPICRVQTHREIVPEPACEAGHRTQVGDTGAPLDPTDHWLADAHT
jgi:hypothetical protein